MLFDSETLMRFLFTHKWQPKTASYSSFSSYIVYRAFSTKRMPIFKLTTDERKAFVEPLKNNEWELVDGRDAIKKKFKFENFNEAFGFMTRIALQADKVGKVERTFMLA